MPVTKQATMDLSRLNAERQEEAAQMLADGDIRTIEEYRKQADLTPIEGQPKKKLTTPADIIADIKREDKDFSRTAADFLAEMRGVTESYLRGIAWFYAEDYDEIFPSLSKSDLECLKGQIESVCSCARKLYRFAERKAVK